MVLSCGGAHDEGLAAVEPVLARDPDFLLALYAAGTIESSLSRYEAAIAHLERAVRLSDRAPFYLALLGQTYARAGR